MRAIALGSKCSSPLLWRHPGWRVRREPLIHKIRYYSRSRAHALRAGPVAWPFLPLPMAGVDYHQSRRMRKNSGEKLGLNPVLRWHFHAGGGRYGRRPCVALSAGLGQSCQPWVAPAGDLIPEAVGLGTLGLIPIPSPSATDDNLQVPLAGARRARQLAPP